MSEITSLQNPRVKQVVKLRNRRERDGSDRFLIEGYRELLRAQEKSFPVETLYYCQAFFLGSNEGQLLKEFERRGTELVACNQPVFQKMSYRDRPDGLLAVAPQMHRTLANLEEGKVPFYVVAEAVEKPGNLGTILRSSDAAGVDAMIVCDRCTDIHNPNVVRASVGTLFTVPVVEASGEETFEWLKQRGVTIVASTPSATKLYTDVSLTGPVALLLGTEQYGLSDQWLEIADVQVRIPMNGVADSLNVATAATLLMYEVVRQRCR